MTIEIIGYYTDSEQISTQFEYFLIVMVTTYHRNIKSIDFFSVSGFFDVVKVLIEGGANIDVMNKNNLTPLMSIIQRSTSNNNGN